MRCERERQPERRGKLRAEQARPEQPDRHFQAGARHGANQLPRRRIAEVRLQLDHVVREAVGVDIGAPPERTRRVRIGARRAAEPEVDPAGEQRFERPELLGDDERRMIRQHHAAGADADRRRPRGDVADDDGRRGAGDSRHVVVLGEPIAREAPSLGVAREIERVAKGIGGRCAGDDRREVEHGEPHHGPARS